MVFSPNLFSSFLHEKDREDILVKTTSILAVLSKYWLNFGKKSSKVIGKVDAFVMHQVASLKLLQF
jgi:hypothetical protein